MLIRFGSAKTSMKRLLVPLVLTLLAGLWPTQAAENLLKDGGFEQYLLQPDDYGNPFKVWSGWKWEGNCQRVADTDIKHEGQAGAGMLGYGPCKLGISQTVRTEAGWYRLSGWVRAVELKPGLYERDQYPDTHRIYDGAWCGHIIADKWSGGVSGANCVICLESSHTREACVQAYRKILPSEMRRKARLISLLDYEYFYICYCERTRDLFRDWLKEKFGTVEKLNQAWGTHHPDFADIQLPDYRRREPNDAKRYDWLDFNLWRFVDFLKWAKAQQRQIDPDIPMATCAPHYNFTREWGESGSDVETLPEAERFLRTGLDIRRLRQEILAFQQDIKAPVALLYSKASLLQVPAVGGDKTPCLLELDRTYDALLHLGVPVDFITTKQVLQDKLTQYRVLIIPAATYEQADVVRKVLSFAEAGGRVVLVPNSWFFDQYNRKQDYLAALNIQVSSMKAPTIVAGQARTGLQRDAAGETYILKLHGQ